MAVVRWEPVRELTSIQSEMNRLFNTFFEPGQGGGSAGGEALRRWTPAMDLVETEDTFVLRADLPGVAEGDVHIEVEGDVLTVSGERQHEAKGEGFYRVERSFGRFARSLTLPEGVDADGVAAAFDKGVLEVRIPKPEARAAPRRDRGRRARVLGHDRGLRGGRDRRPRRLAPASPPLAVAGPRCYGSTGPSPL